MCSSDLLKFEFKLNIFPTNIGPNDSDTYELALGNVESEARPNSPGPEIRIPFRKTDQIVIRIDKTRGCDRKLLSFFVLVTKFLL